MNVMQYTGVGTGHVWSQTPCQDAVGFVHTRSGGAILALADGASFCDLAEKAAHANVNAVTAFFDAPENRDIAALFNAPDDLKRDLIAFVQQRLSDVASAEGYDSIFELCATLLFAVKADCGTLIGHIGDGAILCFDETGRLLLRSDPQNAASRQETYFTNDRYAAERLELQFTPENCSQLVMFSDGPYDLFTLGLSDDLTSGVQVLLARVRAGEIRSSAQLRTFLHRAIGSQISFCGDDWSILVLDALQPQTEEPAAAPELMILRFLTDCVREDPADDYTRRQVRQLEEMYGLPHSFAADENNKPGDPAPAPQEDDPLSPRNTCTDNVPATEAVCPTVESAWQQPPIPDDPSAEPAAAANPQEEDDLMPSDTPMALLKRDEEAFDLDLEHVNVDDFEEM